MTTTTLSGFIVRETEAAVAFVGYPVAGEKKPLWLPRKKIAALVETDGFSPSIQIAGEGFRRLGTPVDVTVDTAFLERIGA